MASPLVAIEVGIKEIIPAEILICSNSATVQPGIKQADWRERRMDRCRSSALEGRTPVETGPPSAAVVAGGYVTVSVFCSYAAGKFTGNVGILELSATCYKIILSLSLADYFSPMLYTYQSLCIAEGSEQNLKLDIPHKLWI